MEKGQQKQPEVQVKKVCVLARLDRHIPDENNKLYYLGYTDTNFDNYSEPATTADIKEAVHFANKESAERVLNFIKDPSNQFDVYIEELK